MKRITIILSLLMVWTLASVAAPSAGDLKKALFLLTTYNADGSVRTADTYGVFTSATGEAIGPWSPLSGAASATVTDANGKTYPVETILGANELYDVCRFRVDAKTTPVAIASSQASSGATLFLVVPNGKKAETVETRLSRVETFMDKYAYYVFPSVEQSCSAGLPFVNAAGQLVGLLQKSGTSDDLHATDANFYMAQSVTGLSVSDPVYRQTGIRLEMPKDKKDALILLMMAGDQSDAAKYSRYVEDFIRIFPTEIDGYSARAQQKVVAGDFAGADEDMQTALRQAHDKAEAHAEYARVMYQKLVYNPDTLYKAWTFDRAIEEAREAYRLSPVPAYRHREAQITFSKGDYQGALDLFTSLTTTPLRQNGEVFFEAAQCKSQLKAPQSEVIALLDSAIYACPQPLTAIAAPYVLARGGEYDKAGEYRKALSDYNVYDTLMVGRASAEFYYTRYRCELQVKQYQQALEDIAHAAVVSGRDPFYVVEMASLQLRFNRYEEAIQAADICLERAPESTDAFIIKGLALIQSQKKEEGMQCLQRAKDLGDDRAQGLMEKYK